MITTVTAFLILFGSTFVVSAFRVSGGRADSLAATRDALNGSSQGVDRSGVLLREDSPADYWHALAVKRLAGWRHAELQRNHARGQLRALLRRLPPVSYAIRLASVIYGVPESHMHQVASCESGHNPRARNGIYRGVYQEGPMFERGPFGRAGFSVWDPLANVLTAGYTVSREGWRQWACKP